jgi:hypothetical protein
MKYIGKYLSTEILLTRECMSSFNCDNQNIRQLATFIYMVAPCYLHAHSVSCNHLIFTIQMDAILIKNSSSVIRSWYVHIFNKR